MSEEELNKKMEFIIEQQAQFAAQMEIMREAQAAEIAARKEGDQGLSGALGGLVDIVGQLARSHVRTEDSINSLTEDVSRLEKAQARTDERLNIFINVVERFISGNGGAESPA